MEDDGTTIPDDGQDPNDQWESPTIDSPLQAEPESIPDTRKQPESIGPYRILAKLGEGGFGIVYEAQQDKPVRRRVAIKVIKPGMDSEKVVARFEAERQALALMSHPNIAKVYDGGLTDRGLPYFVMELVKGEPITEFCDRNKVPLNDRLRLLIPVCQAVQHAHSKSVIHRDLKPSNILVGYNSEGHPRPTVIDFGVAKALNQQLTEKTIYTQEGQMIGTPEYMSPEQAEMSGLDIDTRSDVYSLGVVLYELLTGMLPFEPRELRSKMYSEMQRLIRELEPPRPSTRLGTALSSADKHQTVIDATKRRSISESELSKKLKGELDWIVMKCLEKDRERRYATPTALADELQHYLNNEPVSARPPSASYRLGKLVRRNKTTFATAGVISASLIIATVVSVQSSQIARAERERALAALKDRDEALQETKQALIIAEQRLQQVQSLVRVYSGYEQQIRRIQGATSARTQLANSTIEILNQLTTLMSSEQWIQEELARGYLAVGQINSVENDDYQSVINAFSKARTLFQDLRSAEPGNQYFAIGEAQSLLGLASAYTGHSTIEESMEYATIAEQILVGVQEPTELMAKRDRLYARSRLAQSRIQLLDQRFDRALALASGVLTDDSLDLPESLRTVEDIDLIADANQAAALINREQGKTEDAISYSMTAIGYRRDGVEQYPSDAVLRRGLINDLYWLGRLTAFDAKDPQSAIGIYQESLANAEHLRLADPLDGQAFELVMDQRKALATAMRRAGQVEESQQETILLLANAQDYVKQDPLDRLRQRRLFAVRFDQARVLSSRARSLASDSNTLSQAIESMKESVSIFQDCSVFYQSLINNNPLGTYDKFRIDAAEVEIQHAKAVEQLGNLTEDHGLKHSAIGIYKQAVSYYNDHKVKSQLAKDQLRNLSIAYRNIGTLALSLPDGQQAVEYLELADETLLLDRWDAFARKAEAYRMIGDAEQCRLYAQQAFDAIERFEEPRRSSLRARIQEIIDALESP